MIVENEIFRELKTLHARDIINLLLDKNESFSVLAYFPAISFNPPLPKHIKETFPEIILFTLANYTLSSAHIANNCLIFEAGFGAENFGSVVTIPIENIVQIAQDETLLFVNVTATLPKPQKPKNPFEANPRNKKFIKK